MRCVSRNRSALARAASTACLQRQQVDLECDRTARGYDARDIHDLRSSPSVNRLELGLMESFAYGRRLTAGRCGVNGRCTPESCCTRATGFEVRSGSVSDPAPPRSCSNYLFRFDAPWGAAPMGPAPL